MISHLHIARVLSLSKNVQQVLIRQKIEPRELLSFKLQVVVKRFLNLFKSFVQAIESIQKPRFANGLVSQSYFLHNKKIKSKM
jgi:hypothetical protein